MNRANALNIFLLCIFCFMLSCGDSSYKNAVHYDTMPEIFPDYTDIVLPPNIAPVNFIIQEPGTLFVVKFNSDKSSGFVVKSSVPEIEIPIKKWKKLLEKNTGKTIRIEIVVKDSNNVWKQFECIENRIAKDPVDPFIVYRRINPGMVLWENMAIVQRSLEDFFEKDIISNQNTEKNCIHCHSFRNRDPNSMILHMRRSPSGTLIKTKNKTLWLSTKTRYTLSSFVYPAWHPGGQYIAFSTNLIHQNFFGSGERINHVRDNASDIVIYDLYNNEVFTTPEIASKNFENMPSWSPDGNFLYYIQADYKYKHMHDSVEKYDLLRIEFDQENKRWGEAEMLVSSEKINKSVSYPQVSPDGKYVLFCLADYGYFNINNSSSDLYILDFSKDTLIKLPVNSEYTESFPSWSGNGHWILFASKRFDGMFTLPFLSYVDSTGTAHKPFVIPFEKPVSYYTRLTNMNRPVFLEGKVECTQKELLEIAYSDPEMVIFDSIHVQIDALAGATANVASSIDESTSLYKKN